MPNTTPAPLWLPSSKCSTNSFRTHLFEDKATLSAPLPNKDPPHDVWEHLHGGILQTSQHPNTPTCSASCLACRCRQVYSAAAGLDCCCCLSTSAVVSSCSKCCMCWPCAAEPLGSVLIHKGGRRERRRDKFHAHAHIGRCFTRHESSRTER